MTTGVRVMTLEGGNYDDGSYGDSLLYYPKPSRKWGPAGELHWTPVCTGVSKLR